MPHYVIGDVQGCYDELIALTNKIKFNPSKDKLIFAGDLVNRGPKSLEVLNFCIKNKKSIKAVLPKWCTGTSKFIQNLTKTWLNNLARIAPG